MPRMCNEISAGGRWRKPFRALGAAGGNALGAGFKRAAVCVCVAFALALPCGGPAGAAEKTDNKAVPLRVGTFELPPWGWVDKDGTPRGIIYDLHQDIATRTGMPFTNELYPFARLIEMLGKGELDFVSGQPHQSLLEAGEKLALLHTVTIVAVTKKGSDIHSLQDLKGKTVIFQRVASYPQLDALPGRIIRVESYDQAIQILFLRNEADAAVFSEPSFYFFRKAHGYTDQDFGDIIPIERDREDWVFVRRGLPQPVKEALKKAVEQATRDHAYDKLLDKYGAR